MREFKPILSEDPKDMVGASEWAKAELERMEKQEKSQVALMEHMRPYILEVAKKKNLVAEVV